MALHTALPIYKVAYNLFDVVTDLVKNMPRDFKSPIGGKISGECIEIMMLVFRANCARDKTPYLSDLIERLQVCELLLRLSRDKRIISTVQYAKAMAKWEIEEFLRDRINPSKTTGAVGL